MPTITIPQKLAERIEHSTAHGRRLIATKIRSRLSRYTERTGETVVVVTPSGECVTTCTPDERRRVQESLRLTVLHHCAAWGIK